MRKLKHAEVPPGPPSVVAGPKEASDRTSDDAAAPARTVRDGLQLLAASETYARLRQLRGKVRFSRTAAGLKADR